MKNKYEIIEIDQTEVTVDVSLLTKTEEMFFNATEIAKSYKKDVREFLRSESTKEYIKAILNEGDLHIKNKGDLVITKRGRYGGTWLHKEIAFEFAGWCSALFRRNLHKWVELKLKEEQARKLARLEAKTGFLPLTNAIMEAHDPAKFYHYSTEADMMNKIVLGMSAKKFKQDHCVDSVRDACTAAQVRDLKDIQEMNTTLVRLGIDYHNRKKTLTEYYESKK